MYRKPVLVATFQLGSDIASALQPYGQRISLLRFKNSRQHARFNTAGAVGEIEVSSWHSVRPLPCCMAWWFSYDLALRLSTSSSQKLVRFRCASKWHCSEIRKMFVRQSVISIKRALSRHGKTSRVELCLFGILFSWQKTQLRYLKT